MKNIEDECSKKTKKKKVKLRIGEETLLNKFTLKDYYRKEANLLIAKINNEVE